MFFSGALCGQFAIKWLLNILPRLKCVATLLCEIQIKNKLTKRNKRVGKEKDALDQDRGEWYVWC